jgi:hypothetical protein
VAGTENTIEARLERRFGRPALFCPSGRLALFLALTERFSPGQRLLMSPLDDDVVALVVLSAGLRPVMAPVDPADGNIAIDDLPEPLWGAVDGVLTTNLYGLPDRSMVLRERCDRHGLGLIEDVAHALVVDEAGGRPVGHRGDASILSFSKHGRGPGGGALLLDDRHRLTELREERDRLLRPPHRGSRPRKVLSDGLRAVGLDGRAGRLRDRLRGPARDGHRMAVRPTALRTALAGAPDLVAADPWVGIDARRYRDRPTERDRRSALAALERADLEADERTAGVEQLRSLPAAAPRVRSEPAAPLFRVPLLVADRDAAASVIAAGGLPVHYVYDPPLDDLLGPEFVDVSPDPSAARLWSTHVLPVDPLEADLVLALCAAAGGDVLAPLAP